MPPCRAASMRGCSQLATERAHPSPWERRRGGGPWQRQPSAGRRFGSSLAGATRARRGGGGAAHGGGGSPAALRHDPGPPDGPPFFYRGNHDDDDDDDDCAEATSPRINAFKRQRCGGYWRTALWQVFGHLLRLPAGGGNFTATNGVTPRDDENAPLSDGGRRRLSMAACVCTSRHLEKC